MIICRRAHPTRNSARPGKTQGTATIPRTSDRRGALLGRANGAGHSWPAHGRWLPLRREPRGHTLHRPGAWRRLTGRPERFGFHEIMEPRGSPAVSFQVITRREPCEPLFPWLPHCLRRFLPCAKRFIHQTPMLQLPQHHPGSTTYRPGPRMWRRQPISRHRPPISSNQEP